MQAPPPKQQPALCTVGLHRAQQFSPFLFSHTYLVAFARAAQDHTSHPAQPPPPPTPPHTPHSLTALALGFAADITPDPVTLGRFASPKDLKKWRVFSDADFGGLSQGALTWVGDQEPKVKHNTHSKLIKVPSPSQQNMEWYWVETWDEAGALLTTVCCGCGVEH